MLSHNTICFDDKSAVLAHLALTPASASYYHSDICLDIKVRLEIAFFALHARSRRCPGGRAGFRA